MGLDLNAIKAAAEKLRNEHPDAHAKSKDVKGDKKRAHKNNADTKKEKAGASYLITSEFKQSIKEYLHGRNDMKEKLGNKQKSIDGCCEYIFDVMRRRAEVVRNGASSVGLYIDPQEVFGLAVHYYDESEEKLKSEFETVK